MAVMNALAICSLLAWTAPRTALRRQPAHVCRIASSSEDTYTGSPLILTYENVEKVVADAQADLGTIFGSSQENLDIGITGGLELIDLEGPVIILRLKGTFWHTTDRVQARVENYVRQRIPECVEVEFEPQVEFDDDGKGKGPTFA